LPKLKKAGWRNAPVSNHFFRLGELSDALWPVLFGRFPPPAIIAEMLEKGQGGEAEEHEFPVAQRLGGG